ncbi:hypothetical protein ANCCEY_04657 [Ancylostoma ceylanicum]|uniref:Uncharacterized protein n=1 Tax=Ancylostoma ceylanicum TaxID=53326 RepID=A0A0D6LVY3_9BILA|nr:hypothetical protein ANCCEY_04657 [Ancylostoma ceylanicum]
MLNEIIQLARNWDWDKMSNETRWRKVQIAFDYNYNNDLEYERLIKHLCDSAKRAENWRTTKRRLSHETLELIRQRGAARAAGNYQLTSELAKRCREAIREDLKERRAALLAEAAEAGRSIHNTRRDFANRKPKMTALRRPDGTITSSRRVMEKVIYDCHLCSPPSIPSQGGWICHPVGSPLRSPTCHQVCEESYSTRS